jgi:hypothetical protein
MRTLPHEELEPNGLGKNECDEAGAGALGAHVAPGLGDDSPREVGKRAVGSDKLGEAVGVADSFGAGFVAVKAVVGEVVGELRGEQFEGA